MLHAPSETVDLYKDYSHRRRMLAIPCATPLAGLGIASSALPVGDFDKGRGTTGDKVPKVWTRENPRLSIEPNDFMPDDGREICSLLQQRNRERSHHGRSRQYAYLDLRHQIKEQLGILPCIGPRPLGSYVQAASPPRCFLRGRD